MSKANTSATPRNTTPRNVAIVGATGAVGYELLRVLEARQFPLRNLRLFASARSAGKQMRFQNEDLPVETLSAESFHGIDLALFSAGGARSRDFAPHAQAAGAVVVDNSSAFRMDAAVPLVVPEVNPQSAREHRGIIANPNCSTIALVVPLAPLHRAFGIRHVHVATYQAASGAGAAAMEELQQATRAHLEGQAFSPQIFPYNSAFNLFPLNSPMDSSGYCEEELKMLHETRKILQTPALQVNAFCVRVPVLRAHSQAVNVEFSRPVDAEEAREVLRHSAGVRLFEDPARNRWATPRDATGQDDVLVGRIREDLSRTNTLDLWIVADQLRKGAALNAVQIAELL